jgi:non-ribosomal peptide synthase protein (TIGR01720 family)
MNGEVLPELYTEMKKYEMEMYKAGIWVNIYHIDSRLNINIDYNKNSYSEQEIRKLINGYKKKLEEIILYCMENELNFKTISDFATDDLNTDDLEIINSLF